MNAHLELPRTDTVPHPKRYLLEPLRPLARWIIRRRYDVVVHHPERVPATGPVVFAANHAGVIDGPLLAIFAPRPVHALTKIEMFGGRLGTFLLHSGQVPLDRFRTDVAAVRSCLRVLRDGRAIGIFPEGRRGSGELERFHRGLPPRGGRIDVVIGRPTGVPARAWPRTREQVEATSRSLWEHMRAELDDARRLTGRELPGPLPPGDLEPDPATGVLSLPEAPDTGAP